MTEQDIEALLPFYALDTLSDEERAQVEQYARSRPEVQAQLDEMVAATAELSMLASPATGTAEEKQAFLDRIRDDSEKQDTAPAVQSDKEPADGFLERLRSVLTTRQTPAFAAFGLVLIFLLVWALFLRSQLGILDERVAALESEVLTLTAEQVTLQTEAADLAVENAALKEQLLNQQLILAALGRPGTQTVVINGTESNPEARATLIVNLDEDQGFLTVAGLTPLPATQNYQLWLIRGDQPSSAGVFAVDETGQSLHLFPIDPEDVDFNAVGVSIEPAGGSQQPTGDIVLFGNLSA